jgi:hypothetical protein
LKNYRHYGGSFSSNPWIRPEYAGEQWRTFSTLKAKPHTGVVINSGTINEDGLPEGTGITFGFNVFGGIYMDLLGYGITELTWVSEIYGPFDPPPGIPGPIDILCDNHLYYSCEGEWVSITGETPW